MKKMIYIADDENDIRDVMKVFLENAGFEVITFENGDELYEKFNRKQCDLVVLDIMMPGTDGLAICEQLRKISDVPIIILTAKESEAYHMKGFIMGGDDYIIKPFSPSLLVLRIQALLRRVDMCNAPKNNKCFGDLEYDEKGYTILCKGININLTVTEFSLMGCLINNPGVPISREELLNRVWGIDAIIETRVTDETVRKIRKKLRDFNSSVEISAVWGYGYKLEVTQ